MPELKYKTITELIEDLPKGHPALTKKGNLRKGALRVIENRGYPSRYNEDYDPDNPVRNTELFNAIADEIEFFPESYDQEVWGTDTSSKTLCGTAFCIAGHGAHLTGWNSYYDEYSEPWENVFRSDNSGHLEVSEVALVELGLTELEGDVLFSSEWKPAEGFTVPDALRAIGQGELITVVSEVPDWMVFYNSLLEEEPNREIKVTG